MPVWFALGSLSLGFPSAVLRVLVPLKCTWIPFLLHSFLNFSLVLGMYGTTMVALFLVLSVGWLLLVVLVVLLDCWLDWMNLWCHWLRAQGGIGSVWGLFWCGQVPCPCYAGMKKQFWPYVPGCWKHFVLLWCDGCCPSVSIDLCGWVFCILWCWRCCLVVWWLEWPRRGVSPVVLVPLWIGYVGPGCWYVVVGPDCVLPCWWQRCHLQTSAKGKGWGKEERACTLNSSMKMLAMRGLMGDPIAAPCTCS